jgi:hypothetical protein
MLPLFLFIFSFSNITWLLVDIYDEAGAASVVEITWRHAGAL